GHPWPAFGVGRHQTAASDQWKVDRVEKIPPHGLDEDGLFPACAIRAYEAVPLVTPNKRHRGKRRGPNARNSFDSGYQAVVQVERERCRLAGGVDPEDEQVVGVESDLNLAEIVQGADEEGCAGEEHEAYSNLQREKRLGEHRAGHA